MPPEKNLTAALLLPFALCLALLSGCSSGDGDNNRAPLAKDDSRNTAENTPVTIDVLANDTDADGNIDPATISITTPPANGNAEISAGKVIYTPNPDYSGSDSFGYTVQDQDGLLSNGATVTINVTDVNDAPVAVNDAASTGKNVSVDIDVLANDTDPDGNDTIVSVTVIGQPASGMASVNGDKSIHYEPAQNYSGSANLTYRIEDNGGLQSTATVTVTVTNSVPQAVGSCSTTKQEQQRTGKLGASDPDPDEALTFALGANGSAGNGPMTTANGGSVVITDNTTGAYIYTPKPNKGGRGRDSFIYQVTDSSGATATATETVIVDLKIMPLGDSITTGITDVGNGGVPSSPNRKGYRQPLQQKLTAHGYSFDFVGALDHGCSAGYDYDANGWPGYSAQQILDGNGAIIKLCDNQDAPPYPGIQAALDNDPADIILLHIGTNDVAGTSGDDIAAILDDIDAWENSANGNPVTVILAQIIDSWLGGCTGNLDTCGNPAVTTLNNEIDAMVQSRSNDDVILVDQYNALNYPDDIGDLNFNSIPNYPRRLHPADSGYEKMADVWLYPLIHQGTNRVVRGATGILMDKCN